MFYTLSDTGLIMACLSTFLIKNITYQVNEVAKNISFIPHTYWIWLKGIKSWGLIQLARLAGDLF